MSELRVGLVGTGGIGRAHIERINASREGRVDGPTAWDGYVAQIAAECASEARDKGISVDINIPEMPAFYK